MLRWRAIDVLYRVSPERSYFFIVMKSAFIAYIIILVLIDITHKVN